ncbi:MAG: hypothetical protein ACOYI4_01150 [Christensenellales bacterium]|jgi:hypothetical protein
MVKTVSKMVNMEKTNCKNLGDNWNKMLEKERFCPYKKSGADKLKSL